MPFLAPSFPTFCAMTTPASRWILGETYEDGQVIFRAGDPGEEMYFIQEGEVDITFGEGDDQTLLIRLGKGQFFGEMALLDRYPRSATAIARGNCRLTAMGKESIRESMQSRPEVTLTLIRHLCSRVRALSQAIEDLARTGAIPHDRVHHILMSSEEDEGAR